MDYAETDEQQMIRELVRDFAEREYHTDKSINEWDKIFSNHKPLKNSG